MRPIDSETKKPWTPYGSGYQLKRIRGEVLAALRSRDEGRGLDPNHGFRVFDEIEHDEGNKQPRIEIVFDPLKMAKRHNAAEIKALTGKRWAEFCSEPRCEREMMAGHDDEDRRTAIATAVSAGDSVERSLGEEMLVPSKRGPGRPAGSKNRPKD